MKNCNLEQLDSGRWYCPVCDPYRLRTLASSWQRNCHPEKANEQPPIEVPTTVIYMHQLQSKLDTLLNLPDDIQADVLKAIEAADTPDLRQKARHYIQALEKWAKAGFPLRTMEHAQRCRDQCLACPSGKYDANTNTCAICGCGVGVSRFVPIKSKPRMATEKCPKGHWPEAETSDLQPNPQLNSTKEP